MPPPPLQRDGCRASCLRRACVVPATCVQRREDDKPPPPPTHTSAPPRVGDEGREGRTAAPPPDQGGKMGRQRREGAGRTTRPCLKEARAVQAPAGGAQGERTQGGKGDDGSHPACPSPLQRDKCRASCLRRACDVLTPEEGQRGRPPPPPPSPPPTKERGEDSEEEARGHGGGDRGQTDVPGEETGGERLRKKKKTTTNKAYQRARGRKREDGDKNRGERGEAGVTWACMGRW